MEHCKKLSSWDIYGVRSFPYRGARKYPPGIHQTFNGSIIIQNDVFGLTIWQFEREFKACLKRRKQHEQRIQNIRFPEKTSNEYIEYLKYGDATIEDSISVIEQKLSEEDRCYRHLIQVAGSELEIRTRQRMFSTIEKIRKIPDGDFRYISSGSLAEGIDLPGSDIDVMLELPGVTVIDDFKYLFSSMGHTTLLTEHDDRYPGFCKLKLVAKGDSVSEFINTYLKAEYSGLYLSTERFVLFCSKFCDYKSYYRHGPCISDAYQHVDNAFCLGSTFWPANAINWICRHRPGQWPSENLINIVVNEGCLFVPIGPKNGCNEVLWRISFSVAEKRLIQSMNYTQLLCYVLLKLTQKNIINRNENVKDLLCSYFLKTTLFWLSEEICIDTFKITNLSYCFYLCIDKLISFVRNCFCPNYFIPHHNLFIGKVDESNNKLLLSCLDELRNTELKSIIGKIFGNNLIYHSVSTMTGKNKLSLNLDLLFYRVISNVLIGDIDTGYKTLKNIKLLMVSESSEFLLGVLGYYHALINQQISQMLVLPEHRRKHNDIKRRCRKHLMDGTKSDAVSGWLLYASFNYVFGDYEKTLQIIDNVLSRCAPGMIILASVDYATDERDTYKHTTDAHLTLHYKMRQSTVCNVRYIKQSTLIPQELQLEVQDGYLYVPPVVMSQCLQLLCYHHLGDVNNKLRALRQLQLTIKERFLVSVNRLSDSLVLLGACCEISGYRDTAYDFYYEALLCEHYVCPSAEQRIKNLLLA